MDERVELFLRQTGPVLCIDIGGLTQNALLARPGQECENWPRFTLPSRAVMVAQRIRELSLLKQALWLYGSEMGGGFAHALREHVAYGLQAFATPEAARSIHNDPKVVEKMGIVITPTCPPLAAPILCADYDSGFWSAMLRISSLPQPHMVLAAVQDHGDFLADSRKRRMEHWESLLAQNPDPVSWVCETAPEDMSRLRALQKSTGGPVADTAACAILGAVYNTDIFARSCREGITIINAGNVHTLGALIYQGKVCAIYEHHTQKQNIASLLEDIRQFKLRWLPAEQVHEQGGNGTAYSPGQGLGESFNPTFILGPRHDLLRDFGSLFANHGNMEHAGCYGLLYGWARSHARV